MRSTRTCTRSSRSPRPGARGALAALLVLGLVGSPVQAETTAQGVVQQAIDQALVILRDDGLALEKKRANLEKIAYRHFDFGVMSQLVLGRSRKKLTDAQRTDFEVEFRRHLGVTYGRGLGTYSDETLALGDERKHGNGDVTIASSVVGGPQDGAKIDYRMRNISGEWKVIDVVVEGVSLISSFKSQVQEIIRAKGADQLIAQLRTKNDQEATRQ